MCENEDMERSKQLGLAISRLYSELENQRSSTHWGDKLKACGYIQHRNNYEGTLVPKVIVHDHTAINSFDMYVNGFVGYLCPQDDEWFKLLPRTKVLEGKSKKEMGGFGALMDEDGSMELADYLTQVALSEFADSGLYESVKEMFKDGETFGIGLISAEEGREEGRVEYSAFDPQECVVAENPSKEVDVFVRRYMASAVDLMRKYRDADIPSIRARVASGANAESSDIEVFEAILPSDYLYNPETKDPFDIGDGRAVAHVVYIPLEGKVVYEGGFNEMPVFTFTPSKDSEKTPYGNGVVYKYLPSIITLDEDCNMREVLFKRNANPPMLVHNALRGQYSGKNGSIVYTGDLSSQGAVPLFREGSTNNYQSMINDIMEKQSQMRTYLNADLFRTIMSNGDSRKTAYEVSELKNEAVTLLSMKVGSFGQKVLEPIVKRTLKIKARSGALDIPEGIEIDNVCKYIDSCHIMLNSVFFRRLQSYLKYEGYRQGLGFVAMVAQLEQSQALGVLDKDALLRAGLYGAGFPAYAIKSKSALERERRAQQEQANRMMQMQEANQKAQAFANAGRGAQAFQNAGMDANAMAEEMQ